MTEYVLEFIEKRQREPEFGESSSLKATVKGVGRIKWFRRVK